DADSGPATPETGRAATARTAAAISPMAHAWASVRDRSTVADRAIRQTRCRTDPRSSVPSGMRARERPRGTGPCPRSPGLMRTPRRASQAHTVRNAPLRHRPTVRGDQVFLRAEPHRCRAISPNPPRHAATGGELEWLRDLRIGP